jgi:hypothetical protein
MDFIPPEASSFCAFQVFVILHLRIGLKCSERILEENTMRVSRVRQGIGIVAIAAAWMMSLVVEKPVLGQARTRAAAPSKPAPRFSDGTPNLGITLQDKGLWLPLDRGELGRRATLAPVETIPFQPWAKALYEDRQIHELEPHTRCHASGVARQFQTPYGVDFVHAPDIGRMYIFDVGGPHTFRIIYMDGRSHPKNLEPSNYGHSVGHWEGDSLVVDSVGFSENFWIDRTGLPHTERLHTVERFTRTDFDTIKYEVLIDDPLAYTKSWSGGFNLRWTPGDELFEYICQDNNTAPSLMMKDGKPIELSHWTIP